MPPAENKQAVQEMLRAFSTGDLSPVDRLLDDQFRDREPIPGTDQTAAGLKKQINHLRQAFPDVQFEIENIVAEGETVAFRWRMSGTHSGGEFLGHPPSHKAFTHVGHDFITFHNGKIYTHESSDQLRDLLTNLGHAPEPKPAR